MKIDEMHQEDFFVLVAPDGTPQTATLGQDIPESFAITKLLAKAGYGQTPEALIRQGFRFMPVKLTITQNGPHDEAKNLALAKPKGLRPSQ
ncbi:hypothetical protein DYU11_20145 [Fibrisoma montanum]|uniref:Uncharacterized protein n=1 Tax=Fibrisoma montanum TaxID=2305895 RepID=A0A418M3G5_9BACT|nr:hypothetical protein [Fibrisoma montanum]RIV20365.1 hypothetical protein DYU11_20145 [Fibrisoma montanum]